MKNKSHRTKYGVLHANGGAPDVDLGNGHGCLDLWQEDPFRRKILEHHAARSLREFLIQQRQSGTPEVIPQVWWRNQAHGRCRPSSRHFAALYSFKTWWSANQRQKATTFRLSSSLWCDMLVSFSGWILCCSLSLQKMILLHWLGQIAPLPCIASRSTIVPKLQNCVRDRGLRATLSMSSLRLVDLHHLLAYTFAVVTSRHRWTTIANCFLPSVRRIVS